MDRYLQPRENKSHKDTLNFISSKFENLTEEEQNAAFVWCINNDRNSLLLRDDLVDKLSDSREALLIYINKKYRSDWSDIVEMSNSINRYTESKIHSLKRSVMFLNDAGFDPNSVWKYMWSLLDTKDSILCTHPFDLNEVRQCPNLLISNYNMPFETVNTAALKNKWWEMGSIPQVSAYLDNIVEKSGSTVLLNIRKSEILQQFKDPLVPNRVYETLDNISTIMSEHGVSGYAPMHMIESDNQILHIHKYANNINMFSKSVNDNYMHYRLCEEQLNAVELFRRSSVI